MEDNDKIYYDKEEIEQYELTIKKASELIKEEVKEPKIVVSGMLLEKGIQKLIDYPCKNYLHDFSLINFKMDIWQCIHCSCKTRGYKANLYHKYRYKKLYNKEEL